MICGPFIGLFTLGDRGRAPQPCPGTSDLDFFSDLDGVVNLDAKIANGALHSMSRGT